MNRMIRGVVLLVGTAGMARTQTAPKPMEHHEEKAAARSTTLVVTLDGKSTTLTLDEVKAMPQRTLTVRNGHSSVDETYTGVGLSDLLAKFGLTLDGVGAKRVYHSYVRAEGTDKYWVLYSTSEVETGLRTTDAIVALTLNSKPLEADGAFKMVAAGEKKPARWVRNLAALTVVTVE